MAMKKGLKARWVAALRSGEYQQHKAGSLVSEEGESFCCLGVLREISPAVAKAHANSNNVCYLSDSALRYAGFTHEDQKHLSELNDNGPRNNFKRIANYIEKNL